MKARGEVYPFICLPRVIFTGSLMVSRFPNKFNPRVAAFIGEPRSSRPSVLCIKKKLRANNLYLLKISYVANLHYLVVLGLDVVI